MPSWLRSGPFCSLHQSHKLTIGAAAQDSDKDAFWGVGPDGRGRNELGKALERLRSKLREG